MRLLQCDTEGKFSLTREFGDDVPPYAILSHTWGPDSEEVTFKDINGTGDSKADSKAGYDKIRFCGEQARRDGLQYFWVDTCCIDKSNSTELGEAINSMFRWYQNATKCYVYLSDVSTKGQHQVDSSWELAFQKSRWFTRGWTLQELLAPLSVQFFCSNGRRLGDKKSLEGQLLRITGIPVLALQGSPLSGFSIKERMSWAEDRETKREEDKAYSLLGIFDVQMPFIYGERGDSAFGRLQEEIQKRLMKHQLEEVSTVTFNPSKRLKTSAGKSSSILSRRHSEFPDAETLSSRISGHNIDATTKQSLIDQLYFTKIDERLTGLAAAQGTTCRWFLAKSEYKSWHDSAQHSNHGGFLWIKGNPGTGKSTLMKLLFEEAKLSAKGNASQITLSFFFLAQGTTEEKSTMGLYRSLLHQLFQKVPDLGESLEWMTPDGARGIQGSGWHEEALKQSLIHAVQKLGSRLLTIFIDALDECDKNQATGMVNFFEELCDRATEAQVRLQICFSSRHYPTIVIQKGLEVTLEEEAGHEDDIKQYIKSKLRLGKSKQTQAELLRSEILEKSSMIFLWVVLVVEILNSRYPDSSFSVLRERLKDIPPGLAELFEIILERDGENLDRLQLCFKWILFATRPLKPQELYFAIQIGLDQNCPGYWDQEDVDLDQIKIFVRNSSKGLAEVTRNKASEVQFIHESVRDFLLGRYENQWSGGSVNFEGHGHEILKNCCLAQLNASISQDVYIPNILPKASKERGKELREKINLKYPFLEYSVLNVLCHANYAQRKKIGQEGFLAGFHLERWILLNNSLEKYDTRRYTQSVSMSYILGERNLADLIRISPPQEESFFDTQYRLPERYGLPIFAALATGSHEAVQAFLEIEAKTQLLPAPFHDLCKQYCQDKNKGTSFGRNFTLPQSRDVLSCVAEHGNEILLRFLLESELCLIDNKEKTGRTPLSLAATRGDEASVKLLIEQGGAEVDSKDREGRTPLLWAVLYGYDVVAKLLIAKGAEVDTKDREGRTPLSFAAALGYEALVKLLIENGAKVDSMDREGRTPLIWAVADGQEAMVEFLLAKGTGVDFKDPEGRTLLSMAAMRGQEAMVRLLIEKGAHVDLKDRNGRTQLMWAAMCGHEAIVELLIAEGAEVDSKDQDGRTPLSRAATYGCYAVVELLIAEGAEVDSKDQWGQTPLFWAAKRGQDTVTRLLINSGAKVDSEGQDGQIPLSRTAVGGYEAVIKLLIEKGADVNSKDREGRTLLS